MGNQRAIAAQIREQNGDYVFALKKNQSDLYEEVHTFFSLEEERQPSKMFNTTPREKGHGRIERLICTISSAIDHLSKKD